MDVPSVDMLLVGIPSVGILLDTNIRILKGP